MAAPRIANQFSADPDRWSPARSIDAPSTAGVVNTDIPARLDRLYWSRFHSLVVTALGVTWILDGLEVTVVGSLSGALADHRALGLTPGEIGLTGSAYIAGAVIGAL